MATITFRSAFQFDWQSQSFASNFLLALRDLRQHTVVTNTTSEWLIRLDVPAGPVVSVRFTPVSVFTPGNSSTNAPPTGAVGEIAVLDASGAPIATFTDLAGLNTTVAALAATPGLLVSGNDDFTGSSGSDVFRADFTVQSADILRVGSGDSINSGVGDLIYYFSSNPVFGPFFGPAPRNTGQFRDGGTLSFAQMMQGIYFEPGFPNAFTVERVSVVEATPFSDIIRLDGFFLISGPSLVLGGDGDDFIQADDRYYDVWLDGGPGNDVLRGATVSYGSAPNGVYVNLNISGIQYFTGNGYDLVMARTVIGSAYSDILTLSDFDSSGAIQGLLGGVGDDLLTGSKWNDWLLGQSDNDVLVGNGGDDTLWGGRGNDLLDGGIGIDIATYDDSPSGVFAVLGNGDFIYSGVMGLDALRSIEVLIGSAHSDILSTEAISGATLRGGDGDDRLFGDPLRGINMVVGGAGNDDMFGAIVSYEDATSNLTIDLNISVAQNVGAMGFDRVVTNHLIGGSGNDRLTASDTNMHDLLPGQSGCTIEGGDGADTIFGGARSDMLAGNRGNDDVLGGGGDDVLLYDFGFDILDGGTGSDTIDVSNRASGVRLELGILGPQRFSSFDFLSLISVENLQSGQSSDILIGSSSANRIQGGGGDDRIEGLDGNDTLVGEAGSDYLFGGADADRFVFTPNWGVDRVADFQNGSDRLDVSSVGIAGFGQLIVEQSGANTLIAFNGQSIVLENVAVSEIDASDFIFGVP